MNTKQIRLTTTASTRVNINTTTRKKHNIQNTNNKRRQKKGNVGLHNLLSKNLKRQNHVRDENISGMIVLRRILKKMVIWTV
jgi:hypothetical protein